MQIEVEIKRQFMWENEGREHLVFQIEPSETITGEYLTVPLVPQRPDDLEEGLIGVIELGQVKNDQMVRRFIEWRRRLNP